MLNQIILVGRLTRDITVNKSDNGVKVATISLAIPRSFKNSDGDYDTDFVDCVAFENIAANTSEYCSKGDVVGVKGRIQTRVVEKDDKKETIMEIICEKITFLSSKGREEKGKTLSNMPLQKINILKYSHYSGLQESNISKREMNKCI